MQKKERKLHVALLDFDDIKNPLLAAGQAKATLEVGKRLASMGHQITVYCAKYPGYKDRTENGITYKHVSPGTNNIRVNNILYILSLPFVVPFIKADIVVECFTAPISTLFSPLFTKIPVVGLPTSFDAARFARLYHLPLESIERFGSKFYTYFIALTPYLEEKMKQYNKDIIATIIPQGVAKEYFSIVNKKPEYILFLGRLDLDQKGLDLLLQAYALGKEKIAYPLVIAGDGPDKQRVEKMISDLNLSRQVKLVGFADEAKKKELFSKAKFVAFPSRNEGFSLVSLEAIASGHTLVGFDIPSLSFAKDSVATKVKPFDIPAFAKALIKESKDNSSQKEKMCREFAKQYSWDTVAKQFETFFYEVLQKEAAR